MNLRRNLAYIGCGVGFMALISFVMVVIYTAIIVAGFKPVLIALCSAALIVFSAWSLVEVAENAPHINRTNNTGPR
jgi:hypothetical protein